MACNTVTQEWQLFKLLFQSLCILHANYVYMVRVQLYMEFCVCSLLLIKCYSESMSWKEHHLYNHQLLVWETDVFLICTLTNVALFQAVLITETADTPHCLLSVKQRGWWRKWHVYNMAWAAAFLEREETSLHLLASYKNNTKRDRNQREEHT